MKWTPDQQKAIDSRQGTVLVSAAAGSGKTAVLVERVLERLTDEKNPCDINSLLIVTFTNAAAAQMKDKISAAISKRVALDPKNKHLRRQQLLLPLANICTIDSFCINLIRENIQSLEISPDFDILDGTMAGILSDTAMQKTVEALYEENSPEFRTLSDLVCDSRDDKRLVEAIYQLFGVSRAEPFPELWLKNQTEFFDETVAVEKSRWGKTILDYLTLTLDFYTERYKTCLRLLEDEPELAEKYRDALAVDLQSLESIGSFVKSEKADWDSIIEAVSGFECEKVRSAPRGYKSALKDLCLAMRKDVKGSLKKISTDYMCCTAVQFKDDMKYLRSVVKMLIDAVLLYEKNFTALKIEQNAFEFNDTLHMALNLLITPAESGEGFVRTPLAAELSEKFTEIMVDEYQDVNLAQDMIFSALSKDENNLFMVGDVKQSIYAFRQAMPEIFLRRRDGLNDYTDGNYPARITLGKNFRSRHGITQTVNFIFRQLMSKTVGDMEYDEKEELVTGADKYPEKDDCDVELHLVEAERSLSEISQAEHIADYIENCICEKMLVSDGETLRPVRYGDFCVLLRSPKGRTEPFIRTFTERGIPLRCESSSKVFSAPETAFVMSHLRIVDNPVDDISLLTVMFSPAYGFTPDELAQLRIDKREGRLYYCLTHAAENGNEKCIKFLKTLESLRRLSATVSTGEFVRLLLEETGYAAIVKAMKDSEIRAANLRYIIDTANRYEKNSSGSLSGFIRYAEKAVNSDESAAPAVGEGDYVRVMSIHKSKGLEFPVCFVAECEKVFNDMDLRNSLIVNSRTGIGIKCCDEGGYVKYETVSRVGAMLDKKRSGRSEELRVLYVAMTRAKEKLVIVSAHTDVEKKIASAACEVLGTGNLAPLSVMDCTNYADIILPCLIRHPDAHILRMKSGFDSIKTYECETPLKVVIVNGGTEKAEEISEIVTDTETEERENPYAEEIRRRFSYSYPYSDAGTLVAKRVASDLGESEIRWDWFAAARPAFVSRGELTPAQRGTATHRFMQCCNLEKAACNVESEIERLKAESVLTESEAEAVESEKIRKFFCSPLARRMLKSDKIYRERHFTALLDAAELHTEISSEAASEKIVVQGVVDCAFEENGELVIIDYKTDRGVTPAELAERYRAQLDVYRRCLSLVLAKSVKETLLYSFSLGETVTV